MKEKLKILFGVSALYLLASIMAPLSVASAAEPIVIGVVHSQKFMFSTMMKNSFEMALERINKDGGIRGRPLNLVYGDDQGDRRIGEDVIRKLVREMGVAMLVGGFHSSNTVYTGQAGGGSQTVADWVGDMIAFDPLASSPDDWQNIDCEFCGLVAPDDPTPPSIPTPPFFDFLGLTVISCP